MNGLENIASGSNGSVIIYMGLLGLVMLVVLLVLALTGRESKTPLGMGVGIGVFFALLILIELPGAVKARLNKPEPGLGPIARAPLSPEPSPNPKPEPAPQPQETVNAPSPKPAPEPNPQPVPAPQPEPTPLKPGITIVNEPAKPTPQPEPTPKPAPVAVPTPEPTQPAPQPVITPQPAPTPTPAPPRTSPGGGYRVNVSSNSGGAGRIDIEIRGPIVETSKTQVQTVHLMIILDGKYALTIQPTRYKEQKKESSSGDSTITSVTYFWENVRAGFDNVPPGPHSVMIDVSMDGPQSHKIKMIGSGNLDNDYNGFTQVSEGEVSLMIFGSKNWMSQELERIN